MAEDIGAINFDDVKPTSDKGFTRPGTIDVFKIVKIEFGKSKNKSTPGMTVFFENSDSGFNHTFYLQGSDAEKTKMMLGRVQALLTYVHGESGKLTGNITAPILIAKLKDKELALKVTGEVSNTGKGYANLPFGGFGKLKSELSFLKFTAEEEKGIDAAIEAIESSRSSRSDNEQSATPSEDTTVTSENY
jgi:hypothetical protein